MRYPMFLSQHLFVGTGVIEAGCKTVIGSRLKQSGMFGTVGGQRPLGELLGGKSGGLSSLSSRAPAETPAPSLALRFVFSFCSPQEVVLLLQTERV